MTTPQETIAHALRAALEAMPDPHEVPTRPAAGGNLAWFAKGWADAEKHLRDQIGRDTPTLADVTPDPDLARLRHTLGAILQTETMFALNPDELLNTLNKFMPTIAAALNTERANTHGHADCLHINVDLHDALDLSRAEAELWRNLAERAIPPIPLSDELTCGDCDRPYPVWSTDNDLWNQIIGTPYGMLCPCCFATRADPQLDRPIWNLYLRDKTNGTLREQADRWQRESERQRAGRHIELVRADKAETQLTAVRALGEAWVGFDGTHDHGDAILNIVGTLDGTTPTTAPDPHAALVEALRDAQNARCAYGTREGDGHRCDCKYASPILPPTTETTGCPELRAAIWTLTSTETGAPF